MGSTGLCRYDLTRNKYEVCETVLVAVGPSELFLRMVRKKNELDGNNWYVEISR